MNISEASSILMSWFFKHDSISNEQFNEISPKKTPINEAEAGFSYALSEFEAKGFISKFIGANEKGGAVFTYILKKPLIFTNQNIQISGHTAIAISNTVNSFYESVNDKENICNPIDITGADIEILLEIISILSEQNSEPQKEQKD